MVVDGRLTEEKLTELRSLGGGFAALDHKATLDMSDTGHKLGLPKDLIAMMNDGGGYVVVGTTDKGEPAHDAEPLRPSRFDSADLAALVAKYIATPPVVTSQAHTLDGRAVVLIHVAATPTGLPAIVTRLGEEQLQSGKKSRILEPGCIYVRQGTANVAATDTHWPLLLENYRAQVVAEARQDIDTLVPRGHRDRVPDHDVRWCGMSITAEDFGPAPWSLIEGFEYRREVLVAELAARGWLGIGADDGEEKADEGCVSREELDADFATGAEAHGFRFTDGRWGE
ncbi:hypothetical protein BO218_10970 [Microbacterium paludicola]|nr:hypothetical protein BO218_10970 [Microbacterium paludicola]